MWVRWIIYISARVVVWIESSFSRISNSIRIIWIIRVVWTVWVDWIIYVIVIEKDIKLCLSSSSNSRYCISVSRRHRRQNNTLSVFNASTPRKCNSNGKLLAHSDRWNSRNSCSINGINPIGKIIKRVSVSTISCWCSS